MPRPSSDPQAAYADMTARCARAEHCRADILASLRRRGLTAETADAIADRLKREGYLDESRYARAFAHDRLRYNGWGRLKIRAALHARGLGAHDIRDALDALDPQEYADALAQALAAKSRSLGPLPPRERREKLLRFLLGRGFEADRVVSLVGDAGD